jgi:transcriptional regulator with XRE-family HTH domain
MTVPYYPRIRDLREDKDITQTQMGKILSCSQRVYSNYERGDIDIPTATLIKIADYHGVSVDYLLNRTDDPQLHKIEEK